MGFPLRYGQTRTGAGGSIVKERVLPPSMFKGVDLYPGAG